MNKYQEELNNISYFVLDDRANGYDEPRTFGQFYGSTIDILQELVDKATPKKPTFISYDDCVFICSSCNSVIQWEISEDHHNCLSCGQAIDWTKISLDSEGEQK